MRSHVTEHLPGYFAERPSEDTDCESNGGRLLMISLPLLEEWDRATEYGDSCLVLKMAEMGPGDTIQGLAARMQGDASAADTAPPSHVWSSKKLRQASCWRRRQILVCVLWGRSPGFVLCPCCIDCICVVSDPIGA